MEEVAGLPEQCRIEAKRRRDARARRRQRMKEVGRRGREGGRERGASERTD